jgi:hypothetical protein
MTLQIVGARSGIINSNIAGISLVESTIRQAPIFESAPTVHGTSVLPNRIFPDLTRRKLHVPKQRSVDFVNANNSEPSACSWHDFLDCQNLP